MSVSYTHLDVYKRQSPEEAPPAQPEEAPAEDKSLENESTLGRALISGYYDAAQRSTAPGAYDSSTGVWVEFEPVSYTHLKSRSPPK